MAIKPRETWVRDFIAALDTFCAGGRNGQTSCGGSTDPVEAEDPPAYRSEARGGNGPAAPSGLEGHLKVYPDLGAEVLRQRLDLPYRLWLILRQDQPDGQGWVTPDDCYRLSVGTRRQTRTWLKAGQGRFWDRDHKGRFWLASLEDVGRVLGVLPERQGAYIPLADVENLGRFRAMVYAAWCNTPTTISQAKLSKLFGRKPKTLQRWAKLAGLEVGHNLAWTHLPDEADLTDKAAEVKAQYYWTEQWNGPPGQRRKRGDKPNEMVALVWTLPNTYRASLPRAPKTRLQRHACHTLNKLDPTLRATGQRVYCMRGPGQGRRAARIIQAGGVAMVEERRAHHGYGLFERCA